MDDIESRNSSTPLTAIFNSGKKRKLPFEDLQPLCFSPIDTKRKRLFEEECEPPVEKEETLFPQYAYVDVDKEVEQLFRNPVLEAKAVTPSPQFPRIESMTSELQRSIDNFRSFLSENISRLSGQLTHSCQPSSSSQSPSVSQTVSNQTEEVRSILDYVRENNALLKSLVQPSALPVDDKTTKKASTNPDICANTPNPSSSSSSSQSSSSPSTPPLVKAQKEIDRLRESLDAEMIKSAKMLSMLTDTISENDLLSEELSRVRNELQSQIATASEYALLYNSSKISIQQCEEDVLSYRAQCTRLEEKVKLLQKQIWTIRRPSRYSNQYISESEDDKEGEGEQEKEENNDESNHQQMTTSTIQQQQMIDLEQAIHAYEFTNQILVQQVAELRAREGRSGREGSDEKEDMSESMKRKVKELEKRVRELGEAKVQLEKENEEMKELLSKTDLPDYQFIEDSEDLEEKEEEASGEDRK